MRDNHKYLIQVAIYKPEYEKINCGKKLIS